MRYSINVIPEGPIADIVELATRAETLGFDRCWVYDEGLVTRDVYVTMAAIATATDRLVIGPGITNPYTRHPAQTAAAIASLHEVSGGRAFLGLGAGGSLTLDPIGLERRRPLRAVAEAIELARKLYSGDTVTFSGELFELRSATMSYAANDIEIWLAGRGPKMLELGGRVADGVMLDFLHKPDLGSDVERVRSGRAQARICYSTAVVTTDDDLEFVRPHMTYRLVDAPQPVKDALGLGEVDVARIRAAMSGGLEAAAELVRDEWILPFVIAGSAAEAHDEVGRLGDRYGIEEFLLPMFDMPDPQGYLERLGPGPSRA